MESILDLSASYRQVCLQRAFFPNFCLPVAFEHLRDCVESISTMATSLVTPMAVAALATEGGAFPRARRVQEPCMASFRAGPSFSSDNVRLRQRARSADRMRVLPVRAVVKSVDISKVVPQGDRVLVRLEEVPDKSLGGVLLPRGAAKFERYLVGEVLAIGSEVTSTDKGQKVVFSDLNAYEVNLGVPEKLCFCKEKDLLAVVE